MKRTACAVHVAAAVIGMAAGTWLILDGEMWGFAYIPFTALNIFLAYWNGSTTYGPRRVQAGVRDPGARVSTRPRPRDDADTDTSEGTGAGLEPVRAWKGARVLPMQNGTWRFSGITGNGFPYSVDDKAVCHSFFGKSNHHVPHLSCTCGFYALDNRDDDRCRAGEVMLEVELYGRVIEHEHGYRAEHQRVLAVYPHDLNFMAPRPRCQLCQAEFQPVYASVVTPMVAGSTSYTMTTTSNWLGYGDPYHHVPPAAYLTRDGQPLCTRHAVESRRRFDEYPLPDLPTIRTQVERDLPTDWKWVH